MVRRAGESDQAAALLQVRAALRGRVTPALLGVAVKVDKPVVWTRYLFDGEPTDAEQERAEAIGDEVAAGLPGRWMSQVLLRLTTSEGTLVLERGEEWAYCRSGVEDRTERPVDEAGAPGTGTSAGPD